MIRLTINGLCNTFGKRTNDTYSTFNCVKNDHLLSPCICLIVTQGFDIYFQLLHLLKVFKVFSTYLWCFFFFWIQTWFNNIIFSFFYIILQVKECRHTIAINGCDENYHNKIFWTYLWWTWSIIWNTLDFIWDVF